MKSRGSLYLEFIPKDGLFHKMLLMLLMGFQTGWCHLILFNTYILLVDIIYGYLVTSVQFVTTNLKFTVYLCNPLCQIYLQVFEVFQHFCFHVELILLNLLICLGGDLYLENMTSL